MAIELAAFDLLPQHMSSFARGFSAALIATTFCYPLDTLRLSSLSPPILLLHSA
jgi:solute carrier family 25 (mitochondrial phosphate transporter), member 23/24/25/41